MDSSQVFLAKSILQALIKDIDLKNPFHGERPLLDLCGEIFPKNWLTVRLLARQQLLWWIQRREEETTRSGLVMQIYNLLSQQEDERIDERFAEVVDMLEIVPANNPVIERIIFGMDSGYSSE